jgi:hypothetical protein
LPIALVVVSRGLVRRLDASRELVPVLPTCYESAAYVSLALVIALAAVLLFERLSSETRRVTVQTAGQVAILPWAVAWSASGLQGGRLLSLSGVTLLACLKAATVLPRRRPARAGVGLSGVTPAAASGLLAAVQFDTASVACRHECVLGLGSHGRVTQRHPALRRRFCSPVSASVAGPVVQMKIRAPTASW